MAHSFPDAERQQRAREYARVSRRLFMADLALGVALLLALWLSGLSAALRNLLAFPLPARVALYLLLVIAGYALVTAPLSIYRGYVLPRRYGLSEQGFRSWLWDAAKGAFLALFLGLGVTVAIYLFLDGFPRLWWLLTAFLMLCLTVTLTTLAPLIILPLFFKQTPLADPDLGRRLERLAERAHARLGGVFLIDLSSKTTAANAMVAGLGNTRRIILGDTLLERYSPEEIEVIAAHELGHHLHKDIPRFIGMEAAFTLLEFYLLSLFLGWAVPALGFHAVSDVAAFPLLALALGAVAFLLRPLANAYSRRREEAADRYALEVTANPEAFVTMLTKLADQNLAEAEPPRWVELLFSDHAPYSKRVAQARRKLEKAAENGGQDQPKDGSGAEASAGGQERTHPQ